MTPSQILGNQQVSIIAVNAGDIASLNQAKYGKTAVEIARRAAYKW